MHQLAYSYITFRLEQIAPFELFEETALSALRRITGEASLGAQVEGKGAWPRVLEHLEQVDWSGYYSRAQFKGDRHKYHFTRQPGSESMIKDIITKRIWSEYADKSVLEIDIKTVALLIAIFWQDESYRYELLNHWKNHFHIYKDKIKAQDKGSSEALQRECQVKIEISDREQAEQDLFVIWLIRRSKDGKKWLKPMPFNDTLERYREISSNHDPRIIQVIKDLSTYKTIKEFIDLRSTKASLRAKDIDRLGQALNELVESIARYDEVYFKGQRVTFQDRVWAPRFILEDAEEEGHLTFTWTEQPICFIPAGEGWVLDANHRLFRCDAPLSALLSSSIIKQPIQIKPDEVEDFIGGVLPKLPVRLDIRTARCPTLELEPQPVLRLTRGSRGLLIDVRTRYRGFEPAEDDGRLFYDSPGLIQRDLEAEARHRALIEARLGAPPWRLDAHAAYDFLLDELPQLGEGWSVDADKAILRPKGSLTAQVSVTSGVDWFDLEVGFEVGGVRVGASKVLEAWRRKQRYVELPEGAGVARLPEAWLARHAEAVEDVEALRRASQRRLGLHNTTTVSSLLELAPESKAAARWRADLARVRQFERITPRPAPEAIDATLRPYQEVGYAWLTALREAGLGAALADDMGLGKTIQALCLLVDEPRRSDKPALVVAPTSVIFNWIEEIRRFAPSLDAHLYHGPRRQLRDEARVIITSYPLLRQDQAKLTGRAWSIVILDEAQHIKNPQSAVAEAARRLDAEARFALTGTPIENHLMELWSLFQFLMPGFFGSAERFKQRYLTPIQKHDDAEALTRLRERIRPFVLRRLKREVAAELPPRQEQVLYCDLGPEQRRLYDSVREAYRASVLEAVEAQGVDGATLQVLAALTRLRQACCHPALVPLPQAEGLEASAKLDVLFQRLEQLIEDGHRSLIFSQWPSFLQIVRAGLEARGHGYLYLDGQTKQRADLQSRWNDPAGPPVFLVSVKAGGSGLNLTGADHVFHLDPWWNPAVEQQANDRAHRIGQTKPVMIYKLVARDTAEEKILELQARKQALFDAALNEARLEATGLSRADLEAVFGPFGDAPAWEMRAARREAPAWLEGLLAEGASEGASEGVTTAQVMFKLGCSRATARGHLKALEETGVLERRGVGRATRYHLVDSEARKEAL